MAVSYAPKAAIPVKADLTAKFDPIECRFVANGRVQTKQQCRCGIGSERGTLSASQERIQPSVQSDLPGSTTANAATSSRKISLW